MFHSIYLTRRNGVSVYSRHYKEMKAEDQLVSGFVSALGSFSTEALGSDLQSVILQTGERLSILTSSDASVVGIIIADSRDHPALISKLLTEIIQEFIEIFQKDIAKNNPLLSTKTEKFNNNVDRILKGRTATRTILKGFLGNVLSFGLMILLSILLITGLLPLGPLLRDQFSSFPTIIFTDGINAQEFLVLEWITAYVVIVILLLLMGVYFLPAVLSGYMAGTRKRGIVNALLLGIFVCVVISIEVPFLLWWLILLSPITSLTAITCGYFGGYLKMRRKLWPLSKNHV